MHVMLTYVIHIFTKTSKKIQIFNQLMHNFILFPLAF